jgi:hypothetical protein
MIPSARTTPLENPESGRSQGRSTESINKESGDHRGYKDAQQIIQPDIPPGHLVDPEQNKRADLHRHKERQDGKNEEGEPDVQIQIEVKEKGKKQRKVKENDIRQKKKEKFLSGRRMQKFFKKVDNRKPLLF